MKTRLLIRFFYVNQFSMKPNVFAICTCTTSKLLFIIELSAVTGSESMKKKKLKARDKTRKEMIY